MDPKTTTCSNCKKCTNFWPSKFKPSSCQMLQTSGSNGGSNRNTSHEAKRKLGPPLEYPSSSASAITGHPRKRAVLCGVTYRNWKHKLQGTINDVLNMQDLLINHYGYRKQNILILTEDEPDPNRIPTKKNIQRAMKWLVENCNAGDSLVFYFSGHGLRQPDFNMDELDGFDETICPVDFLEEGMISDNEINSTIVSPLNKDVNLHAIVDSCHSGTILDLAYVYHHKRGEWIDNRPPSGAKKSTNGGFAICLSACGDDQFAADTSILTGKTMNGAMTFILIDLIKTYKNLSYGDLLQYMQEAIERANQQGCLALPFFRKIFRYKVIQDPLLSSSEQFDVHKKMFTL